MLSVADIEHLLEWWRRG